MKLIITFFLLFVLSQGQTENHIHVQVSSKLNTWHEFEFVNYAAREFYPEGKVEYKLKDRTRVDLLTCSIAFEFDFAHKWAEAIGQALHYAKETNKKPGVFIILRSPSDEKFIIRIKNISDKYKLNLHINTIKTYK